MNWASTCTSTSAVRDGIREDRDMELEYCSGPRHKSDTNRTPTWKQTRDTNGTQTAHKLAHNWGYDKYVQHKAPGPGDYMLVFFHHNHSPSSMSNAPPLPRSSPYSTRTLLSSYSHPTFLFVQRLLPLSDCRYPIRNLWENGLSLF